MGSFVLQIKNKQQTFITKTHSRIVYMSIYMYIYCTHTHKILQVKYYRNVLNLHCSRQWRCCVMLVKSNC